MSISHTLSTSTRYVSISIVVLAMTLFLAGCPSPNGSAPSDPDNNDVDDNNNGLIEIHNLDMLRNVHYNLAGTSYNDGSGDPGKTNGGPTSPTDHCKTEVDGVYLCGYELTRNLDFTDEGSYATGIIQNDWRPNGEGNPDAATNEGFPGIGAKTGTSGGFTGIFEGNGYSILNLYMRNTTTVDYSTGLFRLTNSGAKIRNLGMMNVAIYGGDGNYDNVGGLVGWNLGTITASYATGTVDDGAGRSDNVGGLVGANFNGVITASYATADVDGGAGDNDDVGGLVGYNVNGSITASYASGTVDGGAGDNDDIGGLVGKNDAGTITASYASGTVDGGAGSNDDVGGLEGNNYNGTITASYGFGEATNAENAGSDGTQKPTLTGGASITMASQLSQPGSTASKTTAPADAQWNAAVSNTLNAWDFGTETENPALKYADYDDSGTTYSCDLFLATIPGTDTPLVCGTTLLPGQGR